MAGKLGKPIMTPDGHGYLQQQSEYCAALVAAQSARRTPQLATGKRERKKVKRESL